MVEAPLPPPPPFLPPEDLLRKNLLQRHVNIEITIFITFILFAAILVLGRLRPRGNSSMRLVCTKLFIATAYLISFIPGLMNSTGESNDLYVFWVAFLAYLAAVSNEVSCYSLADNEDRKKRLIIDYLVVWSLIISSLYKSLAAPQVIVPMVVIFWVVVLKLRERSLALSYATKSSKGTSRATKIISDFTKYQKEAGVINKFSFENFLVGVREAQIVAGKRSKYWSRSTDVDLSDSNLITLNKVLGSNETFLVGNNVGKDLQNTCISFAMFSILLSKIAGYKNVDTKFFGGGPGGISISDHSFALVEKELDFLYDYFFTNYYVIYVRGIWKKLRHLCITCLFFWLAIPLLVRYRPQDKNLLYVVLRGEVLDTGFTRFVILSIFIIEFWQSGVFLTSKWAKVMYTCSLLDNKTTFGATHLVQWVIKIGFLIPRPRLSFFCFSTFTKRKISQYSILKCYAKIPTSIWVGCWIGSYFDLPRLGQAGNWYIDLTPDMKNWIVKAIASFIDKHEGKLTYGVSSLEDNKVEEEVICSYVKNVTKQSRVILIWHIATSLIENDTKKTSPTSNYDNEFHVATIISNYCAYLVAMVPEMLDDHIYTTQCEFDDAVKEIEMDTLGDEEEGCNGVLNIRNSILEEALQLKEKLQQQPNLWRTLAEFWTETLLYLALANHDDAINAHANSLCVGGEFITHLWALLTHAGCSRKPILSQVNQPNFLRSPLDDQSP
ncbi:uncharacterized protein LOC141588308 [Silene latifolia]|uniref:uncharacterized protein LOC141588308 n=1 Tax=Silene latifolia TaxID=37657 RepID=UPI003D7797D0